MTRIDELLNSYERELQIIRIEALGQKRCLHYSKMQNLTTHIAMRIRFAEIAIKMNEACSTAEKAVASLKKTW